MTKVKVVHVTTIDMSLHYLLLNQLCSLRKARYEVISISSPVPEAYSLALPLGSCLLAQYIINFSSSRFSMRRSVTGVSSDDPGQSFYTTAARYYRERERKSHFSWC